MKDKIKNIKVKYVLMDVDDTMTLVDRAGIRSGVSVLDHLVNLVVKKHNVSSEAALKMIHDTGDIEVTCLFDFLDKLEVSKKDFWNLIKKDLVKYTQIPGDTAYFIRKLKAKGIKLYSATTNSRMMTLLKLSLGDLASINGSTYMAGFYGGNAFNDPEGKYSSKFFPSILKHGKFDPDLTMMVGDDLERDMKPALKAGIKYVVMIHRDQPEPLIFKKKAIFVKSLKTVADMLS